MNGLTLNELCKECPVPNQWCFSREFLKSAVSSDCSAIQARLIYDYRFLQSLKEGQNIGNQRALQEYAEKYGAKFRKIWEENQGIHYDELRLRLFSEDFGGSVR